MIFATIMKDKRRFKNFWKKVLRKYRFVIMTSDSFEEKLSVKLSRLNILAFSGFIVFFCLFSTLVLVTTTPLTEYVPGKAGSEVKQELMVLTLKYDSLKGVLEGQNIYLQNIRNIIAGKEPLSPKIIEPSKEMGAQVVFEKSFDDSLLRLRVESNERGSIQADKNYNNNVIMFFPPISGLITDGFDPNTNHFGIDLVAEEKTRIYSILEGTVIVSHWTFETGYVIGVQHPNDYISLYKHNSVLLKSVGDFVRAGDPIAIIGNSGELSSGPHLHFELWHDGGAINPEDYILF